MQRQRMQLGILRGRKGVRHPDLEVTDHAANRDVRLAQVTVEEPWHAAVMFEAIEGGADLRQAALLIILRQRLAGMEIALEEKAHGLVAGAHGQGRHLQHLAPLRSMCRRERAGGACHLVQGVDDGARVDQRLAALKDERGHADERIDLLHRLGVAEDRHRVPREGHMVVMERHRHPAHEGKVILANEDHGLIILQSGEPLKRLLASDQRQQVSEFRSVVQPGEREAQRHEEPASLAVRPGLHRIGPALPGRLVPGVVRQQAACSAHEGAVIGGDDRVDSVCDDLCPSF